ncbi:hypothetical protein [Leptolyngbya ohadii]|uniref:hypothetical protein n=1 Tax=Leptolyngbya ohadii TaxID=1962290 RepID=UPI000B59FD1C|nr:hypothetical protein [Leptolyngbya ohadii]
MKKLYPFLAGLTLLSLGSFSGGSAAQGTLANHASNLSNNPSNPSLRSSQPRLQAQTPTEISPTCPLRVDIAATFLRSECHKVVLTEPRTYYRYYSSDGNRYGRYLTTDRYDRNVDVIRNLALNQARGNQATLMMTVTVPAGTAVYKGIVAPQDPASCYVGGGQQTFIENTRDPNLVWSSGTPIQVEPFQCP